MNPAELTLETALKLLELPKTLGIHPELGEPVVVSLGRFGPYIKCGVETRSVAPDFASPIELTLEQACELLKQPKGQRRAAAKAQTLRELGANPETGVKISLKSGRYGPYVTDGELNASLPRDMAADSVTLEAAVILLAERAASGGGKKKRSKPTRKKSSSKRK